MSILNCIKNKLPQALKTALEKEIGSKKAEAYVEDLLKILEGDKWSIWDPKKDFEQLKEALEQAAKTVGINWSTIEGIVLDAAKSVLVQCL